MATIKNKPTEKLWTVTFVCLVLIAFFGSVSANGLHNGIAVLIEESGEPSSLTGVVISCFACTALCSRLIVGNLSDAYGRKVILLVGAALIVAGTLLAAFTTGIPLLIVSRITMALGFSAIITVGSAAATDVLPRSRRGEGLGYQSMFYAVAMAVGPMIAVYCADFGRMNMFLIFAVMFIVTFCLVIPCKLPEVPKAQPVVAPAKAENSADADESAIQSGEESKRESFVWRYVERVSVKPAIVTVLVYIPMALYMSYMSLYCSQTGVEGIAVFFVLAAAAMVAVRLVLGKAFDRYPINTLLIPSILIGAVGFALPYFFGNTLALWGSAICYGIFCGIEQPVLLAECINRAPDHRRGAASATFYIGNDAGFAFGAFIWGVVIATWGFQFTFIVNIAITLLCAVAAAVLLRDGIANVDRIKQR